MEIIKKPTIFNIGEVAEKLNCGLTKHKLFEFLRNENVCEYNNAPKSEFVTKGYLIYKRVEKRWINQTFVTTLVTEEGFKFIEGLIKAKWKGNS
ncbi:phage antirepressor KilAC domain-containing protein [Pinibacter aurantiacus]|uniref:Phage antirepressor KilAC domain-containing protein n=1 Tax=Pinibacter aurantiacus TaxID=2851599 RepID=A0A9E2S9B1_9BACT|nr:phage antirepressor KilAC domain-containing protein [Pinibacter aurantiacus]MBV4356300.1 phage antirepressor KilAC domain-containing protein [Pinibacter aurantiacus]